MGGKVKERTTRACLDEKYKQKRQVENARKHKVQQQVKPKFPDAEEEREEDLAVLMLTKEEIKEMTKEDEVILLKANGQALLQKDRRDDTDEAPKQAIQFLRDEKINDNYINDAESSTTTEDNTLDCEFCKTYLELSDYIRPFFP